MLNSHPAPRNRAPLGQKTTNAKAHAFQTPGPAPLTTRPGKTVQKSSTRRSARSKIAVAQSEPVQVDVLTRKQAEKDDEPDFGYAPPPPIELPDPPLEISPDPLIDLSKDYGQLYYSSPKDEHGVSLRLKREEEEHQKYLEEQNKKILASQDKPLFPSQDQLNKQVDDMIAAGPKNQRPALSRVDSIQARSAAAALSTAQAPLPLAALKSTQASEQKKKNILTIGRNKPINPISTTNPNRIAHAIVSKTTIGFPKAKKAPSIIPRGLQHERSVSSTHKAPKVDQSQIHPRDFRDLYGSPPEESDMWFRLKNYELLEEEISRDDGNHVADDLFETDFFPFENSKLDDEDFQLPMPE